MASHKFDGSELTFAPHNYRQSHSAGGVTFKAQKPTKVTVRNKPPALPQSFSQELGDTIEISSSDGSVTITGV
jgi:hypothetical protein